MESTASTVQRSFRVLTTEESEEILGRAPLEDKLSPSKTSKIRAKINASLKPFTSFSGFKGWLTKKRNKRHVNRGAAPRRPTIIRNITEAFDGVGYENQHYVTDTSTAQATATLQAPSPTFPRFMDLPTELRHKIWHHAPPQYNVVHIDLYHNCGPSDFSIAYFTCGNGSSHAAIQVSAVAQKTLATLELVCRDSYFWVHDNFKPYRAYYVEDYYHIRHSRGDFPHDELSILSSSSCHSCGASQPPYRHIRFLVNHRTDTVLIHRLSRWSPSSTPTPPTPSPRHPRAHPLLEYIHLPILPTSSRDSFFDLTRRITIDTALFLGAWPKANKCKKLISDVLDMFPVGLEGVWLAERPFREGALRELERLEVVQVDGAMAQEQGNTRKFTNWILGECVGQVRSRGWECEVKVAGLLLDGTWSNDQIVNTLVKSRNTWQQYVQLAHEQPSTLYDSVDLRTLIDRTPAIPSGRLRRNGWVVYGYSTWKYKRQDGCDLKPTAKNILRGMTLGTMHPTICTTGGESFRQWGEQGAGDAKAGNCLAILMFAWAYILSARLVELQGGSICYTEVLAPMDDQNHDVQTTSSSVSVGIGEADPTAVRWWRAILTGGQGWRAALHESSGQSPWSISYQGEQCMKVSLPPGTSVEHDIEQSCPSSVQAMGYLADFCNLYQLRGQPSAALAAALVLPLHSQFRQEAKLPEIVFVEPHERPLERRDFHEEDHALPYLMTLSCTPRFLGSAIWGVFWEPGVDCNLVSAWFRPILDTLSPIIQSRNFELLAKVMALRRPKIASLWLGSIITGLTPSRIVSFLQHLGTQPDFDAAAWTSSPQSFMDLSGSGPYVRDSKITRADVWRLRHDCQDDYHAPSSYRNPPLTGWPPFGCVPHTSVDLEVWLHIRCKRHERLYSHWTLVMADGKTLEDPGFTTSDVPRRLPLDDIKVACPRGFRLGEVGTPDISDDVSRQATERIFAWATEAGFDPDIDTAFKHQWLNVGGHDDDDDDDDSEASQAEDSDDDARAGIALCSRYMAEQRKSKGGGGGGDSLVQSSAV
jgi:hypothetical protein